MTKARDLARLGVSSSGVLADANAPSGSVIQTVSTVLTSGDVTTTSTSFVTTGFALSITPTNASNRIFAAFNFNSQCFVGSGSAEGYATIYRGATNILNTNGTIIYSNNSSNIHVPTTLAVVDSPNTTSSTTYTLFFRVQAGNTFRVNAVNGAVTITLMEIAA